MCDERALPSRLYVLLHLDSFLTAILASTSWTTNVRPTSSRNHMERKDPEKITDRPFSYFRRNSTWIFPRSWDRPLSAAFWSFSRSFLVWLSVHNHSAFETQTKKRRKPRTFHHQTYRLRHHYRLTTAVWSLAGFRQSGATGFSFCLESAFRSFATLLVGFETKPATQFCHAIFHSSVVENTMWMPAYFVDAV